MAKNRDEFETIVQEIEDIVEHTRRGGIRLRTIWIYLRIFLPLMIVGVVMYIFFFRDIKRYDTLSEYARNISITKGNKQKFAWTYDDFVKLDWDDQKVSETSLDEVLEKFGNPSGVEMISLDDSKESLQLSYGTMIGTGDSYGHVVLVFNDFDGEFTLTYKFFTDLDGIPYEDTVGEVTHFWTAEEFDSVKVGEEGSGVGGVKIEEFLKQFGPPSSIYSIGINDELTLTLNYSDFEGKNYVNFDFLRLDETGDFRLSRKDGEFRVKAE
ncbi:hypothetical protein [Streptococcus sp. S784/96/1]|uniref:hypothetical protein n=1 Tax=Streptococcus sp. S784/96/1 TaxID=2653499 RepID=UPI00138746FB|nr:hypothetical protein [Streptococcus sp. S784/96/1]